jgi:VCBS repeat-containing protein
VTIDSQQHGLHIFFGLQVTGDFPDDEGTPGAVTRGMVRMAASAEVTNQDPPPVVATTGSILGIAQNTGTFALLGEEFGGNGTTTFALPDLRGRAVVGGEWADDNVDDLGDFIGGPASFETDQGDLPSVAGGAGTAQANAQPSLTLHHLIRTENGAGTAQVAGTIMMSATQDFTPIPAGYLPADGALLDIEDYPDLFAAIGTTHGGDGVTTFRLPDLTGRTVVGASDDTPLGTVFGSETVTITQANLPEEMGGSGTPIDHRSPGIALHYIINMLGGSWPGVPFDADDAMLGEIMLYAGDLDALPAGWVLADGSILPITANTALFSLLGMAFGGDGATTFGLPDLRDRTAMGAPNGGNIGGVVGSNFTTLEMSDIPALDIEGTPDPDTYFGGDLGDNLRGNGGADSLTGNGGADTVSGGAGADTIRGGEGADSLSGGSEADTFIYAAPAELTGDTIDGETGFDIIRLTGAGAYDLSDAASITSVEFVTLADDSGSWSLTLRDGLSLALQINAALTLTHGVTLDGSALTGNHKVDLDGSKFDGDDSLLGSGTSDFFSLLGDGDDTVDGGGGALDWVIIESSWVESVITEESGEYTIVTPMGTKTLRNVEFVQFGGTGGPGALGTAVLNVAPLAVDDEGDAQEAGAAGAGSEATGNVLGNDSDANTPLGDVRALTHIALAAGTLLSVDEEDGRSVTGEHGTLLVLADGSYTYVVDNDDPAVRALKAGGTLIETFTYRVSDAKGLTDTATLTVTIHGDDDAPVITSNGGAPIAVSIDENTRAVTTIAAADEDFDTIAFSLSGTDVSRFDIDASTGVITFKAAPDFEAPADANGDNVYEVSITASDGTLTDTVALTITVDDVKGNKISANASANRIDTGSGKFNGKGATVEDDRIDGKGGNDTIKGGGGNDTLIGGGGKDKLTGGTGADKFVFKGKLGASNIDTIADFAHDIDLIQLAEANFAAIGPTLTRSEFHAAAGARNAADRFDHIIYDTSTGRLYYDADARGGKAAVHFATLSTKPTLDHGDFAIV